MTAISDLLTKFASISVNTINQATLENFSDLEKTINENYDLASRAAREGTTRETIYYKKDADKQLEALKKKRWN